MSTAVEAHYTSGQLGATILAALEGAGHPIDPLDPGVLMPVEEFHTLGRVATEALAEAAGIGPSDHVLDVGCGIGGPARHLARSRGCQVTGIDLTAEFCEVARDLNTRTGLAGQVEVRQADALDLPFPDSTFDVTWTQHVTMNIADKAGLYRELRRVLKPGGRLAFFDVIGGPGGPAHFPVPWAEQPSISFLEPADVMSKAVEAAGFEITVWEDLSEEAEGFFARMAATAQAGGPPPALGLHLIISDMATKVGNARRNLAEERARLLRCVAVARPWPASSVTRTGPRPTD